MHSASEVIGGATIKADVIQVLLRGYSRCQGFFWLQTTGIIFITCDAHTHSKITTTGQANSLDDLLHKQQAILAIFISTLVNSGA